MKWLLLILSLAVFSYLLAVPTAGQSDAGNRPALPNAFRSPMVIETAFPANPSLWMDTDSLAGFQPGRSNRGELGKWFSIPEWYALGKFTCDGVSLRGDARSDGSWNDAGLTMRVKPQRGAFLVMLAATIHNSELNPDKTATVSFEVFNTDGVIAKDSVRIQTKDNGRGGHSGNVKLVLSKNQLASATKLRITTTTADY
jgi:hypothetical protein